MKKIILALTTLFIFCTANAQKDRDLEVIVSTGVSYYTSFLTQVPTIHVQPRLDFVELSNNATVSLDVRFAGGYFEEKESIAGESYPVFEIPVTVNFNYGVGASRVADMHVGVYGGLGAAWEIDYGYNTYWGPMFTGGFRFDIDKLSPIDLNVGLMLDVSGNYNSVFSAGISYMFGMLK